MKNDSVIYTNIEQDKMIDLFRESSKELLNEQAKIIFKDIRDNLPILVNQIMKFNKIEKKYILK